MPRNRSEKTGIIAHKTVFPANWHQPAHVFLYKRGARFWVMSHEGSHSSEMDDFIGRGYLALPSAKHMYEALVDDFWFDHLPAKLRASYGEEREVPPGWLDSKEREQCAKERQRP